MKYMGSKNRIAKHILPIMLKYRTPEMTWVEPFVGGANMIDKVEGKRIGADFNKYLIDFWNALKNGWTPPIHTTKEEYYSIKENKDRDTKMTLWAGICCSYGGKWFGGWINDYKENRRLQNGRLPNHQTESRNGVMKQLPKIKDVDFVHCSYQDLEIPPKSIIYCDPPYEGTTKYKDDFDHKTFWQWCRDKVQEGHIVFVSEYNAPSDFYCVKTVQTNTQLGNGCNTGNQNKLEKLFTPMAAIADKEGGKEKTIKTDKQHELTNEAQTKPCNIYGVSGMLPDCKHEHIKSSDGCDECHDCGARNF